ncbi:centrosomal protein 43 [Nilaparvata lugens]|uniref:centrosomal protein 43 n=1 Tax=Nilaparvata lugens TaxID=108931 RepID=UPI00193EC182|nr:centrosomal protein 43 [Nilaparvata lugens]
MSVDEDNQLHELVSQTLECNGILAKIRAELRASVFLALEDQDTFKDKPNLTNKALGDFVSTSEGALVICLVREFLQFFGLEFTMSVFDPETQLGRDYEYIERADLAKHLRIKSGKSAPLLAQVVQNACKLNNRNGCNEQSENGHPENMNKQDNRVSEDKVGTKISSLKKIASESATNEPSAVENGAINGHTKQKPTKDGVSSRLSSSEVKSMSSTGTQQTARKPDTLHLDLNQTNCLPNSNSSLCSLGGLPPLAPITNGQTANPLLSQKDMSNDIKAILEQSLDSQENNYEEDFHSNASERGAKKGQISASSSEIEEEEMSSAGDDQTSISAAVDEGTADTSISQESGHGDYLENV